jgi:hypothetical protein
MTNDEVAFSLTQVALMWQLSYLPALKTFLGIFIYRFGYISTRFLLKRRRKLIQFMGKFPIPTLTGRISCKCKNPDTNVGYGHLTLTWTARLCTTTNSEQQQQQQEQQQQQRYN